MQKRERASLSDRFSCGEFGFGSGTARQRVFKRISGFLDTKSSAQKHSSVLRSDEKHTNTSTTNDRWSDEEGLL